LCLKTFLQWTHLCKEQYVLPAITREASSKAGLAQSIKSTSYRVLRKYLNQNTVVYEQFDKNKFMDLCK
jgi:hypothetical protein